MANADAATSIIVSFSFIVFLLLGESEFQGDAKLQADRCVWHVFYFYRNVAEYRTRFALLPVVRVLGSLLQVRNFTVEIIFNPQGVVKQISSKFRFHIFGN